MSVVGIDFGTRSCVIAVAQRGGVDVITNDVSNRQTPNMVSFGEKERYIGESGSTQWMRNVKNTVTDIKRVIGYKPTDQDLQVELKRIAYKVSDQGGKTVIEVMYRNEMQSFTPETIAGMILGKLKEITEEATKIKCKDVVISVPGFWNDSQRRAILDASAIAGLNCLRLLNEPTASALAYGIYKTDLPETDPIKVMIIDVGESSISVGVVAFQKGQLKVLGTAYDPHLGGRNFDDVLTEHFVKEFKTKYKIDASTNQKALLRLRVACEKLKKVLSANLEAPINVESLLNDIDVSGMMDRKTFEDMCSSLLDKVCTPVQQALDEAKITKDQLFAVEVTGGGSRLLSLVKRLTAFFGKEPNRTLNSEESVARGCALQCAMLSPVFKVREFQVNDIALYPIRLSWKCVGETVTEDAAEVFAKNNPIPSPKMITFNRGNEIELLAQYASDNTQIGKFVISNIPASTTDPSAKVRVKVKLDINGLFNLESVQLVESVEPQADAMETDSAAAATPATPASPPATPASPPPASEPAAGAAAATPTTPAPAAEESKKRKVKRTDVSFTSHTASLVSTELKKATDEEIRMSAADRLAVDTANAKNAVETYIYNIRSRISEDLSEFSTEQEKTTLTKLCDDGENWLYGDGEDVEKALYQAKSDELQKVGEPIVLRKREAEERPDAVKALVDAISFWQTEASSLDEKYSHIEKADRDRVLADVGGARDWLLQQRSKQDSLTKTQTPILMASDLVARKNNLEKFAKPILNKPKPKPKPEPVKPTDAKPAADTKPTDGAAPQPQQPAADGSSSAPPTPDQPTTPQQSSQEPTKETPTKSESAMDVD